MTSAHSQHNHHHHEVDEIEADHGAGHAMSFHGGYNEVILFHFWRVDNVFGLILSCVICALLGVLFEGLKAVRTYLTSQNKTGSKTRDQSNNTDNNQESLLSSRRHLVLTCLHFVQLLLSYCLMLIFMTFNTWLCLAVVTGATLGYFCFASKKFSNDNNNFEEDPACH